MNPLSANKPSGGDYDRPNCRFQCGRGAAWGKPCASGPTSEGQCGGADETHPPCVPHLTLRARRGRLTLLATVLTSLLLVAGFYFGGAKSPPLSANPGPLSAKHAKFTASQGCGACHTAHNDGFGGLVKAVFTHADMNTQCGACHQFAGSAERPHNESGAAYNILPETDCRQCHTEHHGTQAKITTLTDAQCHTCHDKKFNTFDRDHPAFSGNFPNFKRDNIKFDHAKHLLEHFKQPAFVALAPKDCAGCHTASPTGRDVQTAGFEKACARCHAEQIPQNELVLLRLPESPADANKLTAEDATIFMAWWLQRAGMTNYGVALREFLAAAAKDGVAPLAKVLDEHGETNRSIALLAGLNPELFVQPAALWLKRQNFKVPEQKPNSGWYWMEDLYPELHYRPSGHADPVTLAWIKFALNEIRGDWKDDTDRKRATALSNEITRLHSGLGRCLKCHAVSIVGKGWRSVELIYQPAPIQPHTKFSHGAHVGLMNCSDCHALNPQADYAVQFDDFTAKAGISNFKSITLQNCTSCHAQNKVRSDCGLCHQYHREPTLVKVSLNR